MTTKEAIAEIAELETTMPPPEASGRLATLASETTDRILALWHYVFDGGPVPPDSWEPSVDPLTEDEKDAHAKYWMEH